MPQTVTIQLNGPDFMSSAEALASKVGVGTISELQVYPGSGSAPHMPTLKPALIRLRSFLSPTAFVSLFVSPSLVFGISTMELSQSCGVPVTFGSLAAEIQSQAEQSGAERWKIQQDIQTKIFNITQDITVNKAKTADKAFKAMDGYIRN